MVSTIADSHLGEQRHVGKTGIELVHPDLSTSDQKVYDLQIKSWISLLPTSHDMRCLRQKKMFQAVCGAVGGLALACATRIASLSTLIHEAVGHCLLGYRLTHSYRSGEAPRFIIFPWMALREGGIKEWIRWFVHSNSFVGLSSRENGTVNALGSYLGIDKREAWISFSGSVPGFCMNVAAVSGGMALRKQAPGLGHSLLALGLTQHACDSLSSWAAALMPRAMLVSSERPTNDFANFAARVGNLLSCSPKVVAIATAVMWTVSLPLMALGLYVFQKSRDKSVVSDREILQHWIAQSSDDKEKAARLEKVCEKCRAGNATFYEVLSTELTKDEIKETKREIVAEWSRAYPDDKVQTALNLVSAVSGALTAVTSSSFKALEVLGKTIAPALSSVAPICSHISPVFRVISLASEVYEVHKDMKISSDLMPRAAKVITVAKLVAAVAGATLILVGTFVPGANILIFSGIVLGNGGGIVLAICKNVVVKRRFKLYQSIQPTTCDLMLKLAHKYRGADANAAIQRELETWIGNVRAANKQGLLRDESLRVKVIPYLRQS